MNDTSRTLQGKQQDVIQSDFLPAIEMHVKLLLQEAIQRIHEETERALARITPLSGGITAADLQSMSEEDRKKLDEKAILAQEEYKCRDYLSILLQLQQSGHECHNEINETLRKLRVYMF